MIRLTIKLIGSSPNLRLDESGESLAALEVNFYDLEKTDQLICDVLYKALIQIGGSELCQLKSWNPELIISLFSDGEPLRPALHFASKTIELLAEVGASLDFDPYVYT